MDATAMAAGQAEETSVEAMAREGSVGCSAGRGSRGGEVFKQIYSIRRQEKCHCFPQTLFSF